jgi:hypothetical protein
MPEAAEFRLMESGILSASQRDFGTICRQFGRLSFQADKLVLSWPGRLRELGIE